MSVDPEDAELLNLSKQCWSSGGSGVDRSPAG